MSTSSGPRILTRERWDHVTTGHPELASHQADVLRAVSQPSRRVVPGQRKRGEEWFYLSTFRPSRWLKVVVIYDTLGEGRILTAFPRRRMP